MINQLGIWTEQPLWKAAGAAEKYNLNLVKGLNDVAVSLAELNQPLSLILSANPSNTGGDTTEGRQIDLNRIPSCICEASRISCIFGQAHHETVTLMQMRNANHTPVGFLGAVMGAIARANVHESIAWVKQFNLFTDHFQEIELGFGDINLDEAEENFLSLNRYESLSPRCSTSSTTRDTSSRSSTPDARTASTSRKTRPAPREITGLSPATAPSTRAAAPCVRRSCRTSTPR